MNKIISIIGSREVPKDASDKISEIAEFFAKKNWTLRTGGAEGVDDTAYLAFKKIQKDKEKIELYLPWQGHRNLRGILWSQKNWDLASTKHPAWDTMSLNSKIFHSRNISIILGLDNETPSDITVCWTYEGEEVGGTAMGIKLSKEFDIPLFNIGTKTGLTKLRKWCKKNV